MIFIAPGISIEEREIKFDFVRASGPGGQNVNKVATAVQLRFDLPGNRSLPEAVKVRLKKLAGKRLSTEGILVIQASRFKSQGKNRQDAIERLLNLIRKAAQKPKKRVKTRPSKRAKARRLETKRRRSSLKRNRRAVKSVED